MRFEQDINGYRVVSKPTNVNAGKCVWAFATKGGKDFFIKEFLEPKIPRPDAMGSVADKQRRFAECQRFEAWHRRINAALRPDDTRAGNLVLTVDFFPSDCRYYKVTRRVRSVEVEPHLLTPNQRRVLLRTLADSLELLHGNGFVHGDLKPENVLLCRPMNSDLYTAKLIDLDDMFLAGSPPPRDVIGGDPRYGAPEWLRYLRGDPSVDGSWLTQAADVFAFALLVHTYLFGAPPGHDSSYDSPAAAVAAGARLDWDRRASAPLAALLSGLTRSDPTERPTIASAAAEFARPEILGPPPGRPRRLRVNLNGRPTDERTSDDT